MFYNTKRKCVIVYLFHFEAYRSEAKLSKI